MLRTSGSLLVAGTTSDAGKSVLTAGICRWLARQGVRVAPFKAQNMSNNSMVAPDGAEIGRAQAMQAAAAGIPAEAAMNPVLLKPGSDLRSQLVVLGRAVGEASALGYWGAGEGRARLLATVLEAYDDLRSRFDVVICEGAGSPAEINLRRNDIVNMGLARARGLPVILIGDIDRGGVFAALYGTLALLDAADQSHLGGFVINKFRGHRELLAPALTQLRALTGRPVLGVVPYLNGIWIDAEDAVAAERPYAAPPERRQGGGCGRGRTSGGNAASRGDPAAPDLQLHRHRRARLEPGVVVRFVTTPAETADADLVVVPGTRATVADLGWLRRQGLDVALERRAAAGSPSWRSAAATRCSARTLTTTSRAAPAPWPAWACCRWRRGSRPARRSAARPATGPRPRSSAMRSITARSKSAAASRGSPASRAARGAPLDGCRSGAVAGTLWHGILENDEFRRAYLIEVARLARRDFIPAPDTSFAAARQAQFDTLADAVEQHLDTGALLRLIEHGPTPGLPTLRPGLL